MWLAAFTVWVGAWFVPHGLVPQVRTASRVLRITTTDLGATFATLPAGGASAERRVVLIGDAAVRGAFGTGALAEPLRAALAAQADGRVPRIVDLSVPVLLAGDALVLAARALALEPDVVLIGVSPRLLDGRDPWATTAIDLALDSEVRRRVSAVTMLGLIDPRAWPRTIAHALWPPLRLRVRLAAAAVTAAPEPLQPVLATLVPRPAPRTVAHPSDPSLGARTGAGPQAGDRAVGVLLSTCGRDGRCLVFDVPQPLADADRPSSRNFRRVLAARARRAGVSSVDLHDVVPAGEFARARDADADPLGLTPSGAARLAAALAPAVRAATMAAR